MKFPQISRLFLIIAIIVLIGNTVATARDYQDSWVLEGLEISFALFVITYAAAFFSEKRTSWMVALAAMGRTVFLLIPNVKYAWFQGPFVDQHVQYALANYAFNEGHIATQFAAGQAYTTTPLLHLSFSIFSTVLNVPVVDSLKYLPVLWSLMYPLLTYVIVKEIEFPKGILKYALFFSSVPFSAEQYEVTGGLFGILLAFLVLSTLVQILQKSDRRYWFVCTIFVFALAAAHSVTSVILAISLLVILLLRRVLHFGRESARRQSYLRASIPLGVTLIIVVWLMFLASATFRGIVNAIFVSVPTGTTPQSEYISPTFFEHLRTNILSGARSFIIYYGLDAIFLVLTLVGLLLLLIWRKKLNRTANFIHMFGWLTLFLMVIGYVMKIGAPRMLGFARLLFPVFAGVVVLRFSKKPWVRKLILPVIFSTIMLLATIELYGCQPLVPPANVLYMGLPPDVPMGYVGAVNSIYQRQMISFVENHVKGRIAAVGPTLSQIIGLTGINFSATRLFSYYPIDRSLPEQQYDVFLIDLPGKSGAPAVEPQLRTASVILEYICNSSTVYTNGESYILLPISR